MQFLTFLIIFFIISFVFNLFFSLRFIDSHLRDISSFSIEETEEEEEEEEEEETNDENKENVSLRERNILLEQEKYMNDLHNF
jgi:uncharacterized ion transporter superfamily protein YfcC